MDSRDNETKKRRIPPNLRKRALVSCDRCKKRRVRCLRPDVNDSQEACQSCLESGVKCESTLPRKQRIYGSIETLNHRFRVLDALIKGLFPSENTENIDTLYSIAEAHNIIIPISDQTFAEDVLHQAPVNHTVLPVHSSPQHGSMLPPPNKSINLNPFESSTAKIPEEKLIPAPHGSAHYIGPSSSFGFVMILRRMVAEHNAACKPQQPPDERSLLQSDFAGLKMSKALEPKTPTDEDKAKDASQTDPDETTDSGQTQSRSKRRPFLKKTLTDPSLISKSKNNPLFNFLPTREIADALVDAYFDKVHPNYMLFHRGTFQLRYESMWNEANKPIRDLDAGWICCAFMIFVFGAQALEHHDQQQSLQLQRRYVALVQSRVHQLISTSCLVNVQAILLLQLHQHNVSERNTAWMLLGCASRMAIAIGMHRDGATGGFDSIEREVRRRVWWTLYVFEQNLCMVLGRPSAIDELEVTVNLPNETMLDGGVFAPPNCLDYTVRLTKLSAYIKRKIYCESPNNSVPVGSLPKASIANQLLEDLELWHRSLPPHLRLEYMSPVPKQRRAVILLHIQYHHAQTLVTRPFLMRKVALWSDRHLGKRQRLADLDENELQLSNACGKYAMEATALLIQLSQTELLDGVAWDDAYYIYHAVLVLSLDFLIAHRRSETCTADEIACKTAVLDLFEVVRVTKLCPTYTVLTQVSFQFARIVGIFDDPLLDVDTKEPCLPHVAQQVDLLHYQSPPVTQEFVNQWFPDDAVNLSWDFFATNGFEEGVEMNNTYYSHTMPISGTFSSHQPKFGDHDETNRPALSAMNVYGSWGPIDDPVRGNIGGMIPPTTRSDVGR